MYTQSGHSRPQVTMSSMLARLTASTGSGSTRSAMSIPTASNTIRWRMPEA